MALSPRALKGQLQQLAAHGEALSAQMQAVAALTARATVDVSALLGPVAMLDELYARGMMQGLAWVMRDADFPILSIGLQRAVLKQSALWATVWGHAATLPVRASAPRLEVLRGGVTFAAGVATGVRIEQIVSTATLAGVDVKAFWHTSSDTQVSLGRLLGYDYALQTPVDNPSDHWLFVLSNMAPVVPNVDQLLAKFTTLQSPSYADVLLQGEKAIRVVGGVTLPQIAAQVLGDAGQWQALAQLNGLRSPYISNDPVDQLGAARGNRLLAQAASAGSSTLVLTDVTGLLTDQRVYLRFGDTTQVVTIRAVNAETETITISPTLMAVFPLATVVTIYNPTYDVFGRVLQPGEYLVLPTTAGLNTQVRGVLLRRGATVNEDGLYGVDVRTTAEGNLQVKNGDLERAHGRVNVIQALSHRFQVPRGSMTYHPLYGSDLHRLIGQRLVPYAQFFAGMDARQTLLRDPRAAEVEGVHVEAIGDRLLLDVSVRTTQNETFPVRTEVQL